MSGLSGHRASQDGAVPGYSSGLVPTQVIVSGAQGSARRSKRGGFLSAHGRDQRALHAYRPKNAGHAHIDPRQSKDAIDPRSEEHTSELQSLMRISYAVFCLKKKKQKTNDTISLN